MLSFSVGNQRQSKNMVAVVVACLDVISGIRCGFKTLFFVIVDDVCLAVDNEGVVFVEDVDPRATEIVVLGEDMGGAVVVQQFNHAAVRVHDVLAPVVDGWIRRRLSHVACADGFDGVDFGAVDVVGRRRGRDQ